MALSNSQYDAILRTYHVRQAENARGQAARIAEIGSNIDRAGLIVLYLDERMAAMTASLQNMLSYLNDKMYESNKMLIIIGKRKDYEKTFDRKALLTRLEEFFEFR